MKKKPYHAIVASFVVLSGLVYFGGVSLSPQTKELEPTYTLSSKEVVLERTLETFNWVVGADLPSGLYQVKSDSGKGAFFVRNSERKKILSETFEGEGKGSFFLSLQEGMIVALANADKLILTEVSNFNGEGALPPGLWTVGSKGEIAPGEYTLGVDGDLFIMSSKANSQEGTMYSDGDKITLSEGEILKVLGRGEVTLSKD